MRACAPDDDDDEAEFEDTGTEERVASLRATGNRSDRSQALNMFCQYIYMWMYVIPAANLYLLRATGNSAYRHGRLQEAIDCYSTALQLDSRCVLTALSRGVLTAFLRQDTALSMDCNPKRWPESPRTAA